MKLFLAIFSAFVSGAASQAAATTSSTASTVYETVTATVTLDYDSAPSPTPVQFSGIRDDYFDYNAQYSALVPSPAPPVATGQAYTSSTIDPSSMAVQDFLQTLMVTYQYVQASWLYIGCASLYTNYDPGACTPAMVMDELEIARFNTLGWGQFDFSYGVYDAASFVGVNTTALPGVYQNIKPSLVYFLAHICVANETCAQAYNELPTSPTSAIEALLDYNYDIIDTLFEQQEEEGNSPATWYPRTFNDQGIFFAQFARFPSYDNELHGIKSLMVSLIQLGHYSLSEIIFRKSAQILFTVYGQSIEALMNTFIQASYGKESNSPSILGLQYPIDQPFSFQVYNSPPSHNVKRGLEAEAEARDILDERGPKNTRSWFENRDTPQPGGTCSVVDDAIDDLETSSRIPTLEANCADMMRLSAAYIVQRAVVPDYNQSNVPSMVKNIHTVLKCKKNEKTFPVSTWLNMVASASEVAGRSGIYHGMYDSGSALNIGGHLVSFLGDGASLYGLGAAAASGGYDFSDATDAVILARGKLPAPYAYIHLVF
jgi:hypothetical protein